MVLHNTQLRHCFRDRVIVIFLWLLFSQPILCGLVKSCVPPPAKAWARWVRAIAASLRSPKMKQKIIGAMFSRLFLKTKRNLRYSVLCMPSAIIYNLWIFTPWFFERKLDFVVQKPWVQTFDERVEFSVWIKSWRNYIIERARTEFNSLVAKLVNKNLYVALWSISKF